MFIILLILYGDTTIAVSSWISNMPSETRVLGNPEKEQVSRNQKGFVR